MSIKMPTDASCEELLSDYCTFSGWLRKEPVLKLLGWRRIYCVISDRCFYYYKNETSKKPAGKFPLYGFNKVRRNPEVDMKWGFILEPIHPKQKVYKFFASSQQEMVEWMKHIKEEMLRANNQGSRTIADGSSDGSLPNIDGNSIEKIEEKIYDDIKNLDDLPNWDTNDNSDTDSNDTEPGTQAEEPVPQFQVPNLPNRKPKESRSNQRLNGYEDVNVLADPSEHVPQYYDQKDYWKSIHFDGEKDQATKIIEDIAKDGVYLVRKSDDSVAPLAVVVYSGTENKTKKFKIHVKMEGFMQKYYMKESLTFDSLEELIYYYIYNPISVDKPLKLKQPYLLV